MTRSFGENRGNISSFLNKLMSIDADIIDLNYKKRNGMFHNSKKYRYDIRKTSQEMEIINKQLPSDETKFDEIPDDKSKQKLQNKSELNDDENKSFIFF
ncbi:hypothetical protein H8356DRAFT_1358195 [Neocallimastix lanati (nom. inval.)]|nr:hypothetical protein H8356DRAFT_1358195 [Neocallimastix sp. JGI-2020a]